MATKWQSYTDFKDTCTQSYQLNAVRDTLAFVERLKSGKLSQFYNQIVSLKTPERAHLLTQTELPFLDTVGQDSQIFIQGDVAQNDISDFLDRNFGMIVPGGIRPYMAQDLSLRLSPVIDAKNNGTGDEIPDETFTYITRIPSSTDLYRLDLNFVSFSCATDGTANNICGNTFTLSGLLSTVDRGVVYPDCPHLRTIVKKTYKAVCDPILNPNDYSNAVDEIVKSLVQDPTKTSNYAVRMIPSFSHGMPLFSALPTQNTDSSSSATQTYFLKVPMGSASDAAKPIQALFAGSILNQYPSLRFDVSVAEDDEVGSRLKLIVTSLGATAEAANNNVVAVTSDAFFDSVFKIGKSLVENALVPVIVHYFGVL